MSVDPFDKYLSKTFRDTTFLKYVVFNSTDSSVFSSIIRENTFLLGKEELVSLMETFLVKKKEKLYKFHAKTIYYFLSLKILF